VLVGELARALGLPVPELVLVEVDPVLGRAEPDEEVQDLLRASAGLNLGMDFLPGALGFDPVVHEVPAQLASQVLWLDAYVGNVDRSWRNPNLLLWHRRLQLIDHGATLVFHHDWSRAAAAAGRPYDASGHVLEGFATEVPAAGEELARRITPRPARAGRRAGARTSGWPTSRASPPPPRCGRRTSTTSCGGSRRGRRGSREGVRVRRAARDAPVDRGESINIGILLYCQADELLTVRVHVDAPRLRALTGASTWTAWWRRPPPSSAPARARGRRGPPRSVSASGGSRRRAAPSWAPGRCTAGWRPTRRARSSGCSPCW
jgi:hypothetical protein